MFGDEKWTLSVLYQSSYRPYINESSIVLFNDSKNASHTCSCGDNLPKTTHAYCQNSLYQLYTQTLVLVFCVVLNILLYSNDDFPEIKKIPCKIAYHVGRMKSAIISSAYTWVSNNWGYMSSHSNVRNPETTPEPVYGGMDGLQNVRRQFITNELT